MKRIIEDILTEEKMARERVDQAREKARQLRIDAENKSKKILAEARQKGLEASKSLIHRIEEEAGQKKEKELQESTRMLESLWTDKEQIIAETIEDLYKMVLGEDVE